MNDNNNENDFDNINARQTLEINQLYQSNDPKLIHIALLLREATSKAMKGCNVQNDPDYSMYSEIEKHAIYLENKQMNQHDQYLDKINRSLELYNPLIIDTNKNSEQQQQQQFQTNKSVSKDNNEQDMNDDVNMNNQFQIQIPPHIANEIEMISNHNYINKAINYSRTQHNI